MSNIINPHRFAAAGFDNTYSVLNDGVADYVGGCDEQIGTGDVTISLWFKASAVTATKCVWWGGAVTSSNTNAITAYFSSTGNLLTQQPGGGNEGVSGLSADTWYHYCLTRNGSAATGKIYVTAASAGSLATAADITGIGANLSASGRHIQFGRYRNGHFFLNGYTDEVSIWSEEKDVAGVAGLYNSGVPGDLTDSSNLLSWWRMGDGDSGTTVTDVQGTANLSLENGSAFAEVVPS